MRLRAAGAQRRDDMREVRTAAGAFDPATERRSLAAKRAPDRDEALALVQFVGPPKHAWMKRLRATGAEVVTYQAENAYVVHAEGAALDRVAALVGADPAVRAVVPLTAADKVEGRAEGRADYAVATASDGGLRIRRRSLDGAGRRTRWRATRAWSRSSARARRGRSTSGSRRSPRATSAGRC